MSTATAPPAPGPARPAPEPDEDVTPRRRRFAVVGAIYALLGVGVVELAGFGSKAASRIPEADVTFSFGPPPDAPALTVDPSTTAFVLAVLVLLAGVAGIAEHRLGKLTNVALGVATLAFVPLILVLSLAYAERADSTNLVPLLEITLRQSVPIALGAMAGLWCERSGVVNIGIEGMLLAAAGVGFTSYALLGAASGGFWLYASVVVAVIVGGLMAALHALLTVTYRTDQIISGVVINLLALGLTSYLRAQVIVPSGNSSGPTLPEISIIGLRDLPIIGEIFIDQPIYFAMFVVVIVTTFVLFRTPFGLRVRSVGENPHAAETLGIDPMRIRYAAVIIGGLIAGLGGAWFSLETVGSFEDNMTNGTGFIALAALIFGKWRPWQAFGGALLFGFAGALQVRLQILDVTLTDVRFLLIPIPDLTVPSELLQSLPYLVTLIVLTGAIGRAIAPAAVGQPFEPSK